jgi:hypothetical protein
MKYNRLVLSFILHSPLSPFYKLFLYEKVFITYLQKRGERGEWEKRGERLENVKGYS